MALGAQVGHVATYLCSPEGYLLYTVFTKKLSKTCQKGVPPVFTGFWGSLRALWTPHPSGGPKRAKKPPGGPSPVAFSAL